MLADRALPPTLGALVGLVLLFGGCAGGPTPAEPTPSPATTSIRSERFDAPAVQQPRDLRGREASPCQTLLTAPQLERLGFERDDARVVPLGSDVQCSWDSADRKQTLSLAAYADRDLLVDTYRTRLTPIFVPTMLAGLPAVVQRTSVAAPSCTVTTGIAEDQALETTWYELRLREGRPVRDPCLSARAAAEAVVDNLPPLR